MKSLCTCRQVVKLAEGTATFYQDDEMEITKQMKEDGFQSGSSGPTLSSVGLTSVGP